MATPRVRSAITYVLIASSVCMLAGCSDLIGLSDLRFRDEPVAGASGDDRGDAAFAGGAGASAGAAGGQCSFDVECDDHRACNGVEACIDGRCQSGTPYCNNPNPSQCEVACTEVNGVPSCKLTAQDRDGDGYGTEQCVAAPGGDCDDQARAVHPGVQEVCDGRDNDCDGSIDYQDGLPLGGTVKELSPSGAHPSIAWSARAKRFAVVWQETGAAIPQIRFALLDSTGQMLTAPGGIVVAESSAAQSYPSIAWATNRFAITWLERAGSAFSVKFGSLSDDGELLPPIIPMTLSTQEMETPAQIASSKGDWIIASQSGVAPNSSVTLTALQWFTLKTSDVLEAGAGSYTPRLAVDGEYVGVVRSRSFSGYTAVYLTRTSYAFGIFEQLDATHNQLLSPLSDDNASSDNPAIATGDGRYAVIWHDSYLAVAKRARIAVRDLKPTVTDADCNGEIKLSRYDGSTQYEPVKRGALVRYPDGFIAAVPMRVVSGSRMTIGLASFSKDCSVVPGIVELTTGAYLYPVRGGAALAPYATPGLAYGDSRIMAVWAKDLEGGAPSRVEYRVFGNRLCQNP